MFLLNGNVAINLARCGYIDSQNRSFIDRVTRSNRMIRIGNGLPFRRSPKFLDMGKEGLAKFAFFDISCITS